MRERDRGTSVRRFLASLRLTRMRAARELRRAQAEIADRTPRFVERFPVRNMLQEDSSPLPDQPGWFPRGVSGARFSR